MKISKTTQSVQLFIAEAKAYGFEVEVLHSLVSIKSHFQPHCADSFNLLNSNGVRLLSGFQFTDVCESEGAGAQAAMDSGVITLYGRPSKQFFKTLQSELCLG